MRPYCTRAPKTLERSTMGAAVRNATLEPASPRLTNPSADSRPLRTRAWPNVWLQSVA